MEPPPLYNPNLSLEGKPAYGAVSIQVTPDSKSAIISEPSSANSTVKESAFGPEPCAATCPKCRAYVFGTNIEYESGLCTWLTFSGCLLFGCWAGCCIIPFFVDQFKDVRHICPNCHSTLGFYRRI